MATVVTRLLKIFGLKPDPLPQEIVNAVQNDLTTIVAELNANAGGDVTGPASSTGDNIATYNGATGKIIKDSGVAIGAIASAQAAATAAQATADAAVPKDLYDANSILAATTNDTPAVLTVPASTFLGRKATGDISAMSVNEANTLLNGSTITTTVAALQALGSNAIPGATYHITDPAGTAWPLYMKYNATNGFTDGYLYVTDTQPITHACWVRYNLTEDKFLALWYPKYNLYAQQAPGFGVTAPPGLPSTAPPLTNCVDVLITMISGNQIQNNALNDVYLNNCRIDGFNLAIQPFYEIWMGSRSWLTLGTTDIAFPYYITMFEDSKLVMEDGSQLQWNFLYSGSYVTVGANTLIDYARYYDGVIVSIPSGKNFSASGDAYKEYKKEKSTFTDTIDVLADTTPDLATIAYAGVQTITCTAASITLIELQNLTPNQEYMIYIGAGKTITFDDGAYFIMKGGTDFIGVGDNGDWFLGKTNADATQMREINRANY